MDLEQTIKTRRSIRIFLDKPVEKEKIQKIVDAGQWAPSACNKQGWKFVAVTSIEIKKEIFEKAHTTPLLKSAPAVIFTLYEKNLTETKSSHIQSASAAIQNMLLTAHSLDLGATWITSLGNLEELAKILNVPDTYHIIAAIILGYPKEIPMTPKRKKIEEILSFEKFDFLDPAFPNDYNPKKWTLKQITKFRENSMCAASPKENVFTFGKKEETEKEILFTSEKIKESDKILEILPFAGTHTAKLMKTKNLQNYHAFELSGQPIEFIKKKLEHEKINTLPQFSFGSPQNLPYENNSFDIVLCFQKLEGLPDTKILSEIKRVLKPGGKFIISFKNMCGLYGPYYFYKFIFFKKGQIWNYGPFKPLNYFSIKQILKQNFSIKNELGISPLFWIGKTKKYPLSFLGRLVIFEVEKNNK